MKEPRTERVKKVLDWTCIVVIPIILSIIVVGFYFFGNNTGLGTVSILFVVWGVALLSRFNAFGPWVMFLGQLFWMGLAVELGDIYLFLKSAAFAVLCIRVIVDWNGSDKKLQPLVDKINSFFSRILSPFIALIPESLRKAINLYVVNASMALIIGIALYLGFINGFQWGVLAIIAIVLGIHKLLDKGNPIYPLIMYCAQILWIEHAIDTSNLSLLIQASGLALVNIRGIVAWIETMKITGKKETFIAILFTLVMLTIHLVPSLHGTLHGALDSLFTAIYRIIRGEKQRLIPWVICTYGKLFALLKNPIFVLFLVVLVIGCNLFELIYQIVIWFFILYTIITFFLWCYKR